MSSFKLPPFRLLTAGFFCGALALPAIHACGPDFPNAYLLLPGETLVALPTLSFAAELKRLPSPNTAVGPAVDEATAESNENEELRVALRAGGMPRHQVDGALTGHTRVTPAPALPREFHLYGAGARAWHDKRTDEALERWRELLALPAAERHHRTVWARYMIGRALWENDGDAACAAFQKVRQDVAGGFADSQGLAVASLGWEARVVLRRADYGGAMRLYFEQLAAGDPSAAPSLQMAARGLVGADEVLTAEPGTNLSDLSRSPLPAVAADPFLRGIVTAWFASRGGPHTAWSAQAARQFRRWLDALPKDRRLRPDEADRWAWAAYQNGQWENAAAFAKLAPADAPAAEWVRAMLLLRDGDLGRAAGHLAQAAKAFPEDPALSAGLFLGNEDTGSSANADAAAAQLGGVRAVLALQRSQFTEALRLFLQAGHWADSSYVAERVLTLDELTAFARAETKPGATLGHPSWRGYGGNDLAAVAGGLRHLLARRLVRAGRFDEAREFFPGDFTAIYDEYVSAVRAGHQRDLPKPERAAALWRAAQLARRHGMEIQGTELGPDYSIWDGNFEWPEIAATRERNHTYGYNSGGKTLAGLGPQPRATYDEQDRARKVVPPTRRFHYRQRAAELAFLAATLLPDDDEQTALILNTAGRWIASRYPDDAQIFYKALVFRCPNTALGKAAAARRWLVPDSAAEPEPVMQPQKS